MASCTTTQSEHIVHAALIKYLCFSTLFLLLSAPHELGRFERDGPLVNKVVKRSGMVLPVADPTTNVLLTGCDTSQYSEAINDKIVMVSRGGCSFTQKQEIAQQLGATAIFVKKTDDVCLYGLIR